MSKRPKIENPPSTVLRRSVTSAFLRPFANLSARQRFWVGFSVLTILVSILVYNPIRNSEAEYKIDDVARETVFSPADISTTDEAETDRQREAVRSAVKPIFRYESTRSEQAVQNFVSSLERSQRNSNANKDGERANSNTDSAALPGKILASRDLTRNELDAVKDAIHDSSEGYIYDDADRQYFANEVEVFDRSKPNVRTSVSMPESNWIALSKARETLNKRLTDIHSLSAKEVDGYFAASENMIVPSVAYDSVATENARNSAADQIQPVTISLKRGEKVIDAGQKVDARALARLTAVRNYSSESRLINRFIGTLLLIAGLFWLAWKYVQNRGVLPRLSLSAEKTFALIGFVIAVQTVFVSLLFRLADYAAAQSSAPPRNDPSLWAYAIPFATGSLLIALLADRPTAIFTGIMNAIIGGLIAPRGLEFTIYAALASAAAVYGIGRYRSRQTVTLAGCIVGVSCAVLSVAMILYGQQPLILNTFLLAIACGLASGIMTAAVTAVLLPVCESIFGILTDVKLLELSNADIPVLGQLALRAPGTNQHSHAVGQLAEEACRAVGANGLLARIGALYHDIGKTAAPEHFVENQSGINPHDRLKPSQSAKIIISHVTYGMKLGKEVGLPARIIDFIPQHHGTRTLHYFLKKAQAEAREDETISENDFRYPGPKPQFRESAIMMIADSCEAGARSLAEPTPENIRFIVTKIIDAILTDDQLNECDLTLKELTQIRESMIKSLVAIYHSRVDYPGYVPPNSGQFKFPAAAADSEERGLGYMDPKDIPVSPGGEIEDEAIDRTREPIKDAAGK